MIPDIQPLKLSVLCCCKNGEIKIRDAIETLANEYELTEDERKELNPSGSGKFKGRVRWAKYSLVKDGLIESTRKGHFKITHRGLEYLNEDGEKVNGDGNLDEDLRIVHNKIKESLQADILDKVRVVDPTFFEFLIIKLLRRMGYGGTAEDSGKVIGKSGDNGVDGVIDQDPLGVDQIYIQAKRYAKENSVSSGDIRNFFGALNLKKAQKGIFITTSNFSSSAKQTARDLGIRIVLIDGLKLSELMLKYDIGCRIEETLHLKKVDEEFFEP